MELMEPTLLRRNQTRKLVTRFVGRCTACSWVGGQCNGAVFSGYQALHHAKKTHPEEFGLVAYIQRIQVSNVKSPDVPMRQGKAQVQRTGGRWREEETRRRW